MFNKFIRNTPASFLSAAMAFTCLSSSATIVEFQTSQGNIQVNLFDESTPKTVQNFLSYVNDGAYTNSIIHRSLPQFIVQGGGYTFNGVELETIKSKSAVINEPIFSNVKGTIAMAKIGGKPNSATNGWFFNLNNNSAELDIQNQGFTIFGQVVANDIATLEKIANIKTCKANSTFPNIPLVDFSCTGDQVAGAENFITIYQILIVDTSSATAQNLNPIKNTLLKKQNPTPPVIPPTSSDKSSGGTVFWGVMFLLGSVIIRARYLIK